MSTLRRQEPVGTGLRRIACEAVEAGVRALTRQADQTGAATKAMREAAAVLALVGPDLPASNVRRDRALVDRLQDGLAEMDRPASLLARLDHYFKKPPADPALAGAVKALRKQYTSQSRNGQALNSRGGNFNPTIYRIVADMAELRGHVGEWPIDSIGDGLPPGLRRTYTRARRLIASPADMSHLGELASAIQLISTQLDLLSKACPPMVKAQRKLLARSAEMLDALLADRALDALLRKQLGTRKPALPEGAPGPDQIEAALATDARAALAETPAAFSNRMAVYWSAWRG